MPITIVTVAQVLSQLALPFNFKVVSISGQRTKRCPVADDSFPSRQLEYSGTPIPLGPRESGHISEVSCFQRFNIT